MFGAGVAFGGLGGLLYASNTHSPTVYIYPSSRCLHGPDWVTHTAAVGPGVC